jgi:hypothetical protein
MLTKKTWQTISVVCAVLLECILNYFSYWTVGLVHHGAGYVFYIFPHVYISFLLWLSGSVRLARLFFWGVFVLLTTIKSVDLIGLLHLKWEMERFRISIEEYRTKHGELPNEWQQTEFEFSSNYAASRLNSYGLTGHGYWFCFAAPSRWVGYCYSDRDGYSYDDD